MPTGSGSPSVNKIRYYYPRIQLNGAKLFCELLEDIECLTILGD